MAPQSWVWQSWCTYPASPEIVKFECNTMLKLWVSMGRMLYHLYYILLWNGLNINTLTVIGVDDLERDRSLHQKITVSKQQYKNTIPNQRLNINCNLVYVLLLQVLLRIDSLEGITANKNNQNDESKWNFQISPIEHKATHWHNHYIL